MIAKILLVDDNKDRRDSVLVILKTCSSLVVQAVDCANALVLLANRRFDLILVDITLPNTTGFSVLKFLETNHAASKVMAITGMTGLANVIKSATPGAQESVTKPFDPNDLLKSIEHILSVRSPIGHKLQIIKAGDFIKSTPTGDLDMNASRQGFAQITAIGNDLQNYTVLIDLRDVKSRLSTVNIYDLASELAQYGKTFRRKTAVLTRADEGIDQAKFFENASHHLGFDVKAFTVFEDAIIWLSSITQLTEDQPLENAALEKTLKVNLSN
jgi:DNA-binding response OmpR family regulator